MCGWIPLQRALEALASKTAIGWLAVFAFSQSVFGPAVGPALGPAFGQVESLHSRIDGAAQADLPWLTASPTEPSQALRRLSLDLRNTIPTIEEIDAYLAEPPEGRWERWVDRFLADPAYRERMVDWYDKTLLQRRPYQNVDRATWIAYLRNAVDANTPIDVLMQGIVQSVWWDKTARAQQRFFLERGGDAHALARDVGRVFFGKDMQCAQCHDHPQVDDYLQIDYHGLLAYVSASSLAEGKTTDDKGAEQKLQMYIEKAAGDAPFESVFNKGVPFRSATRGPGQIELFEPYLAPDERYEPAARPGAFGGLPNAPMQSRRSLLAAQLQASNRDFCENWANRLWALMFGRGLVHPLDMRHFDNPASNPELLKILTDSLIESKFDPSQILRQIALSGTYQRGRRMPLESLVDGRGVLQVQSPEAIAWRAQLNETLAVAKSAIPAAENASKEKQTAFDAAADAWREIQKTRIIIRAELDASEAGFNEANKKFIDAVAAFDKASAAHQAIAKKSALLDEAAQKLEQAKALGDDPEIQASIVATRAKIEALKPQITAAELAASTAATARDGTLAAKETKRVEWKSVVDRLKPVEEQLQQADRAMTLARAGFQESRQIAANLSRRLERLERVAIWFDRSADAAVAGTQLALATQQLPSLQESLVVANNEKIAMEQAMLALDATMAETTKQLEPMAGKWKELLAQKDQLVATKSQLTNAAGLVADAGPLQAAIAQIDASLTTRQSELVPLEALLKQLQTNLGEMQKKVEENKLLIANAQSKVQAQQTALDTHRASIETLQTQSDKVAQECAMQKLEVDQHNQEIFAVAPERALSPEQFGWSILTATNIMSSYIGNEKAELDKNAPLAADAPAAEQYARLLQTVRGARDKLQGNIDTFSTLYSSGVGQTSDDFFASPDQALFVANGGSVYGWAAPNGNNLTNLAIQNPDPRSAVELLARGLLARAATPSELEWVPELIGKNPESKPAVFHELVWGILAGVEFRIYP
jgi:hypothetical protein